jgi:HSP20 family protein
MRLPGYFYTSFFDDDFMRRFFDDPFFGDEQSAGDNPRKAISQGDGEMSPARFSRGYKNFGLGMRTDIKELEDGYELSVDVPGYSKDDVSVKLEKGYLVISASKNEEKEEKDEKTGYIHKERYEGRCSRSYFVGKDVKPEDIKAKLDSGVLKVSFPKVKPKKAEDTASPIEIEG